MGDIDGDNADLPEFLERDSDDSQDIFGPSEDEGGDGWGDSMDHAFAYEDGSKTPDYHDEAMVQAPQEADAGAIVNYDLEAVTAMVDAMVELPEVPKPRVFNEMLGVLLCGGFSEDSPHLDQAEHIAAKREVSSQVSVMKLLKMKSSRTLSVLRRRLTELCLLLSVWVRHQFEFRITSRPEYDCILYVEFQAYDETPMIVTVEQGPDVVVPGLQALMDARTPLGYDAGGAVVPAEAPVAQPLRLPRGHTKIKDSVPTKLFQLTSWAAMLVRVGNVFQLFSSSKR